jgi:Zn-finger protein
VDGQGGGLVNKFATQTETVQQDELNRRKKVRECMKCTWPADRNGNHKIMECFQPVKRNIRNCEFSIVIGIPEVEGRCV